ncbi:group III truncated hemoglobin [Fluviicola chungangensis]|uniref:Group III truncated hemoglobin n=1 Tax=Fluviicola chungangensis TaxID=2597671 RepID=A0A556MPR4_9FLAO|nr:group III truncated hemoglobin [Fluviicola chungangensis]TSJ41933.1 group III truncated hemoglobin [Fluviicola chungangensis]
MKSAQKHDILELEDIQLLVDSFYSKVRENKLLNPIFLDKISDEQWPAHLDKMYRFWQTLLLGEITYQGNPLMHHLQLALTDEHFEEWLRLFRETTNQHFTGEKAAEATRRAEKIRWVFQTKIKQFGLGN